MVDEREVRVGGDEGNAISSACANGVVVVVVVVAVVVSVVAAATGADDDGCTRHVGVVVLDNVSENRVSS